MIQNFSQLNVGIIALGDFLGECLGRLEGHIFLCNTVCKNVLDKKAMVSVQGYH